jgi:hypothetical protein
MDTCGLQAMAKAITIALGKAVLTHRLTAAETTATAATQTARVLTIRSWEDGPF